MNNAKRIDKKKITTGGHHAEISHETLIRPLVNIWAEQIESLASFLKNFDRIKFTHSNTKK